MKREDKQQIAESLHEDFLKSKLVVLTDYKGLDVAAMSDLRKKLKEVNVDYKVVKNTLIRRASVDTDAAIIVDYFKGPSALALSYEDPVAPAKVLVDFAKANEKLEIKIGVLDGKAIDLSGIKSLSSLPSREVLLSQVLSAMVAVPTDFVRVLNNIPVSLLNVLQAIKEKKEAA